MNSFPINNIQFGQFPNNNNIQMMNTQNNNMGGNFVNVNPQIQYMPMPIIPSNEMMIPQYQFQPFIPMQQINYQPQQIPVFPYNNIQQQPIQYVYQQPVYIMPMLPNVVEMQPMGPYKTVTNQPQVQSNNNVKTPVKMISKNNVQSSTNKNNSNNRLTTTNNVKVNNVNNNNLNVQPIFNNNNNNNLGSGVRSSSIDTQKRCINCGTFYKEINNKVGCCRYHTGQFVTYRTLSALSRWNCCKQFDKDAPGCKVEAHVEDLKTSHILSQFENHQKKENKMMDIPPPYNPTINSLNSISNLSNNNNNLLPSNDLPISEQREGILIDIPQLYPSSSTLSSNNSNNKQSVSKNIDKLLEENIEKPLVKDQNGYYVIDHQVQMDDTLQSLAIYYSTTVNDIKFLNNLFSNDIFLRKFLKIRTRVPPNKIKPHVEETLEHKETRLIRRFMLFCTNSKPEEARYYLTNNDWDVKLAVEEYKQDRSFESKFGNVDQQIRKISKKNF